VGLISGTLFFGGLWWTVRAGAVMRQPVIWFPISLAIRAGLLAFGFYNVAANGIQASLLFMAGLLIARTAMFRLIPQSDASSYAP
jgi:F1F0 ATPase subunit 2